MKPIDKELLLECSKASATNRRFVIIEYHYPEGKHTTGRGWALHIATIRSFFYAGGLCEAVCGALTGGRNSIVVCRLAVREVCTRLVVPGPRPQWSFVSWWWKCHYQGCQGGYQGVKKTADFSCPRAETLVLRRIYTPVIIMSLTLHCSWIECFDNRLLINTVSGNYFKFTGSSNKFTYVNGLL